LKGIIPLTVSKPKCGPKNFPNDFRLTVIYCLDNKNSGHFKIIKTKEFVMHNLDQGKNHQIAQTICKKESTKTINKTWERSKLGAI
jgi:hypothetical protein